jgi:hypothetical protein
MKTMAIAAAFAAAGMAIRAEDAFEIEIPVTVYVRFDAADPGPIAACARAKNMASAMFDTVHVRLIWRSGSPSGKEVVEPVVIDIRSHTPETFLRGALAFAQAFEGVHISVFYDRVAGSANDPDLAPKLLAHVLVHEITHVLQRIDWHSQEGVMKAHWTKKDYQEMARKPLPFDPQDVKMIHLGLSNRPRTMGIAVPSR